MNLFSLLASNRQFLLADKEKRVIITRTGKNIAQLVLEWWTEELSEEDTFDPPLVDNWIRRDIQVYLGKIICISVHTDIDTEQAIWLAQRWIKNGEKETDRFELI